MSRKDYVLIAEAIRKEYEAWEAEGDSGMAGLLALVNVAANIADALKAENPNFNRFRFMEAALGEDWQE